VILRGKLDLKIGRLFGYPFSKKTNYKKELEETVVFNLYSSNLFSGRDRPNP
jgi:hypothetical protein